MDSEAEYWTQEAEGVMKDIENQVKEIKLSTLPATKHGIYLNVTTLEGQKFCFNLGSRGFEVVGHDYDKTDESGNDAYETPYALLRSISEKFTPAFNDSLRSKLNDVLAAELENERMRAGKTSSPKQQLNQLVSENSKEALNRNISPWPEWNDSEINAVEWDPRQKIKGKETKSSKKPPKSAVGNKSPEKDLVDATQSLFDDESGLLVLPENMQEQVYSWKRPSQINPNIKYMLAAEDSPVDLLSENKHLLKYEVMCSIVCSVMCLEKEAMLRPFPVEFQSDKYRANGGPIWKPWHHVYSFSKAGKGSSHKMSYNRFGKYIVRLFYLLLPTSEEISAAPECCQPQASEETIICLKPERPFAYDTVYTRAIFAFFPPELPSGHKVTTTCLHPALIANVKYNEEEPAPKWKEYRWAEWAFNNGLISDKTLYAVRNVEVFCPFQEYSENIPGQDDSRKKGLDVKEKKTWSNFDKIIKEVEYLEVFYKPTCFPYAVTAFNIADLLVPFHKQTTARMSVNGGSRKSKNTRRSGSRDRSASKTSEEKKSPKANKNTSKKPVDEKKTQDLVVACDSYQLAQIQKYLCFYLLCDTQMCKTLYIMLSVLPQSKMNEKDESCCYLMAENFNWKHHAYKDSLFSVLTVGTKSTIVKLPPGLQVIRIWYKLPIQFCIQIYSNSPFFTGLKIQIQDELSEDSVTFKYYGKQISQNFKMLLDAPHGGRLHGEAYENFIHSFNPPQIQVQLKWPYWFTTEVNIQHAFEESVVELLTEILLPNITFFKVVEAYQMLFLDCKFGEAVLEELNESYVEFVRERKLSKEQKEILKEIKMKEESDKKRGKKGKSPQPKDRKGANAGGKKGQKSAPQIPMRKLIEVPVDALLLTDPKNVIKIMRKMMEKLPELLSYYPFKNDDGHKLVYYDYNGESKVLNKWTLLFRTSVNIHSEQTVPCGIHLLTPIKKVTLRLIDNDTLTDLPLVFSENPVYNLSRNQAGYTLCAYADTAAHLHNVPWRLRILGTNNEQLLHICTLSNEDTNTTCTRTKQICNQMFTTITGYYIPNKCNLIGRCVMKVYRDATVMLRLKLSNDDTQCELVIWNDYTGELVTVSQGMGQIILPILNLEGPREFLEVEFNTFTVETKVIKKTWILSETEKTAALAIKLMTQTEISEMSDRKRYSGVSRKSTASKITATSEHHIAPSWHLTLIEDDFKDPPVKLVLDTSKIDLLKRLITEWQEDDADILNRGMGYQQQFLAKQSELSEFSDHLTVEKMFSLIPERTNKIIQEYSLPAAPSEWDSMVESDISATESYVTYSQENLDVNGSEVHSSIESHPEHALSGDGSTHTEIMSDEMKEMIKQQNLINAITKFYNDRKELLQIPLDEAFRLKNECVQQLLLEQKAAEIEKKADKKGKNKKNLNAKGKGRKSLNNEEKTKSPKSSRKK